MVAGVGAIGGGPRSNGQGGFETLPGNSKASAFSAFENSIVVTPDVNPASPTMPSLIAAVADASIA